MARVALRPVVPRDASFLEGVYASTRAAELELVPWDEEQKQAFVRSQFAAQSSHYAQQFPDASVDVVLVDGIAAGRLYVDRRPGEVRIVDIALLPAFRGAGVGGSLLRGLLDEAAARRDTVSIHVEHNNPAQTLYRRLGFQPVADEGVYLLMRWSPSERGAAQANTAS
jgi:ribosomal protein S18 acetylase RimI-like enzyme